jgi:CxxC motif-containing protein (DUF1111 family)
LPVDFIPSPEIQLLRRLRFVTLSAAALMVPFGCGSDTTAPPPPIGEVIGDPIPELTAAERAAARRGRPLFDAVFAAKDGLGPLFNGSSCATCHIQPVSGGSSDRTIRMATRVLPDGSCDDLGALGGPVYQNLRTLPLQQAIGPGKEQIPPEATERTERVAPDLFGFGLLDAIPESTILALADPTDSDGDGISGRPNRAPDGRLGRFGRKAIVPTLAEFNGAAFFIEIGVTSPAHPGTDPAPDTELTVLQVARVDTFIRFLSPPFRAPGGAAAARGEQLFSDIGCDGCHVPTLRTGSHPIAAMANRDVAAYTDLLLHDMGPGLRDVCQGLASPTEFRTEPLMGLRLNQLFLHDGRAVTIAQAVDLHGGEATASRVAYRGLSEADRNALLEFLGTL